MEEEKIIIDGVNVRDCHRCNPFLYDRGIEKYPICLTSLEQWGGMKRYCNQRPDCYHKQLKRLEQERDKYKHALEEIKEIAEKEYKTPLGEKDCMNCDDSFKRIENIITEAIGE